MALLCSSADILPEHITGEICIDITLNPHLTALHVFRLMQQRFGRGKVVQVSRKSFYKGVATLIEFNRNLLGAEWREWVYLYMRGNEHLELQYFILDKDDQPYQDNESRSYNPYIVLTSCNRVEMQRKEGNANLANLLDRAFFAAVQNICDFILYETIGIVSR